MPFVKCSVDGCNRKRQPGEKPDPSDRASWVYPECDLCLRPACEKHSTEIDGQMVCDRCWREREAEQAPPGSLDRGLARLPGPE